MPFLAHANFNENVHGNDSITRKEGDAWTSLLAERVSYLRKDFRVVEMK